MTQRRALTGRIRVIQLVWMAGFLIGTTTHVADLMSAASDVYAGFHPATRLFWLSLTLLDPLAAVLVALRNRVGVVLGVLIMAADVAVNCTVFAPVGEFGGLVTQSLFCVFVLVTARMLWRGFRYAP